MQQAPCSIQQPMLLDSDQPGHLLLLASATIRDATSYVCGQKTLFLYRPTSFRPHFLLTRSYHSITTSLSSLLLFSPSCLWQITLFTSAVHCRRARLNHLSIQPISNTNSLSRSSDLQPRIPFSHIILYQISACFPELPFSSASRPVPPRT